MVANKRAFGSHSTVVILIITIANRPWLWFAFLGLGLEHWMKGGNEFFELGGIVVWVSEHYDANMIIYYEYVIILNEMRINNINAI
jgi:hypothetical protein